MLKFDLFRKLPQDLIDPSKSGKSKSQGKEYLIQQVQTEMDVDQNNDDTLLVNMDISFPYISCDFISIDQQDVIDTQQQNVKGKLIKKRILNGKVIDTYLSNDDTLNLERAQKAYEQKEGCYLIGYIIINRVPGNFHISAHPYGGQVNRLLPFVGLSTINLSHSIKHTCHLEIKMTYQKLDKNLNKVFLILQMVQVEQKHKNLKMLEQFINIIFQLYLLYMLILIIKNILLINLQLIQMKLKQHLCMQFIFVMIYHLLLYNLLIL